MENGCEQRASSLFTALVVHIYAREYVLISGSDDGVRIRKRLCSVTGISKLACRCSTVQAAGTEGSCARLCVQWHRAGRSAYMLPAQGAVALCSGGWDRPYGSRDTGSRAPSDELTKLAAAAGAPIFVPAGRHQPARHDGHTAACLSPSISSFVLSLQPAGRCPCEPRRWALPHLPLRGDPDVCPRRERTVLGPDKLRVVRCQTQSRLSEAIHRLRRCLRWSHLRGCALNTRCLLLNCVG